MGVIWTPNKRTTQPQHAVNIDWKNPLSKSLVLAINGNNPLYNIAKNSNVVATNNMGVRLGQSGLGLSQPSTSASGVRADSSRLLSGSGGNFTGMTIILVANPPNAGGWLMGLCLSAQTGTEWYVGWGTQLNGSSSAGTFNINTWNGTGVDVFGVCDGKDHVFAAVFPEGSGTTASAYVDGVKTTGSAANSLPNTNSAAYVGGYWANGYAVNGLSQYLTLGFNRELSSAEILELSRNPWQIFAPERHPLFFNTTGGGSTVTGAGSSAGVGTASGVGASTSAQVGSSAGVGTASGVGRSTANSVGSSSGTGAASGVGSSTGGSSGVGASTGTGTATGVGASTAASLGSTAGVGTASGVGASTAASTGSASGTGTASGVGTNGSVVSTGVGSASGTGTATGISPSISQGGGKTTGKNLSRKQKKKLKAVESQEWLKAEETARQLLSDRFTKQTPQEKAQALETYIESLQPVIEALKALTSQIEEVVEEAPVIELTPHQEVIQRFDRLEKKVKSVEELIIILMADL